VLWVWNIYFYVESVSQIDSRLCDLQSCEQGILTEGEGSVQLTSSLKVACFVKKEYNIFNIKMSWSKLVSTRRPSVLSLSPQQDFPALGNNSSWGLKPPIFYQHKILHFYFLPSPPYVCILLCCHHPFFWIHMRVPDSGIWLFNLHEAS
jgi:hypothetical protein